jgi:hypothetical protein
MFARQSDKRHLACIYAGSNLWRLTQPRRVDFNRQHGREPDAPPSLVAYAEVDLTFSWLWNFAARSTT